MACNNEFCQLYNTAHRTYPWTFETPCEGRDPVIFWIHTFQLSQIAGSVFQTIIYRDSKQISLLLFSLTDLFFP